MSVCKTLTISAAEDLLESALLRPSQVITKSSLSGVRSYDRISAFNVKNVFSLSFHYFANCIRCAGAHLMGSAERAGELKGRISVVEFGFGGIRSVRAKSGYLISIITSIVILAFSPVFKIATAITFTGQGLYEMLQARKAKAFQGNIPHEAMETVFRCGGGLRGKTIEAALERDRETIETLIGENALWLLYKLIEIDMPPIDREEGFDTLCDILGKELASYAYSITKGEMITQEELLVSIESLCISAVLTKIYEEKVNYTDLQKEHAREFLQESAKVMAIDKALHLTLSALNRTAKNNLLHFSRTVRPWLAIEFSREFPHLQSKLLGGSMAEKLEAVAVGRALFNRFEEQSKKSEQITFYSGIACAGLALLSVAIRLKGIAIVIFALAVQTICPTIRSNIAYGYLDSKRYTFDVWEATPSSIKAVYNFFKGKSEPSKKLADHSPEDVVSYAKYAEALKAYLHKLIT